jgi:lipopolysaccharide/colanic/teichoic acid biosynthesis glycosyltransferase
MTAQLRSVAHKARTPRDVSQDEAAEVGFRLYRDLGKRLLDIVLVLASAPLTLPLTLLLAALVATDGHNPIFRQRRVGRHGKVFRIWKLRTMVPDAEAKLDACLAGDPAAAREWAAKQKLTRDPRVTPVGRLLRKTSADELPQLWNVLTGDMSLVGPRPMLECQRALYPGTAYYTLRPGITGPWQVSERNGAEFASRAYHDSAYARTVSLGSDLGLLARTVLIVARGTGC